MDGPRLDRMPRFSTVGLAEKINLSGALKGPLSGYIGGVDKAGYWVSKLQDNWCSTFLCKYAVACNSATSGLLAACMAIGIKPGDVVWTTAYSMSATAACAKVLGATIVFIDIETIRYSINISQCPGGIPKCIIVTNLWGHPAYLSSMRSWCDSNNVYMIEDNAQSPFAKENGEYAGTIGHIGVFSFNVHKHIQAGEGGIAVTNDHHLAANLGYAINHGELATTSFVGLNLRMTEPIAAIACAQLSRAGHIIAERRELALEMNDMVKDISFIEPSIEDANCKHVYYLWTARIRNGQRDAFIKKVNSRNVPMRAGYSTPLNIVFNSGQSCEMVEKMEREIIAFEICAWDPMQRHLRTMREIIKRAAGELANEDR